MGLSGPKKKAKLSHDPNNTAWSRNTESFGHKILSSQGWAPGETLGARNALHASHYTAGSNSHIRVLLKDDQLGLGAKSTGNNAETFGLSLFSGILGRLNGKTDDQVQKEQGAIRDVELALYQSRKGGYVNFVSAGFLVGDRIENAKLLGKDEAKKAENTVVDAEAKQQEEVAGTEAQGTKRKRASAETKTAPEELSTPSSSSSDDSEGDAAPAKPKTKKSKKSTDSSKSKKSSKSKDKKSSSKSKSSESSSSESDERAAKKVRKAQRAERRAAKEERRKKKDAKRAAKSASATPLTVSGVSTSVETGSGSVTPQPFVGRHAVRQRYIAAKGRAHLDPQALKEVRFGAGLYFVWLLY